MVFDRIKCTRTTMSARESGMTLEKFAWLLKLDVLYINNAEVIY